jgi:ubiquinone/menaquinone biosynthesis C-methylase UbiE
MSYEIKTAILDPKTGFNLAADQYKKSWWHWNSLDTGLFLRFLPRNLEHSDILDLGAGDGRIYTYFEKEKFSSFTACDIAENLLSNHPSSSRIKKVVCDLEEALPFEDRSFDLILSFFVLEYIENIEQLFMETERIMRPGAIWVI